MRHFGLIGVAIFLSLSCQSAWADPSHRPIAWQTLRPGLDFARIESARYHRLGQPFLGAVRLEPERVRFQVFHAGDAPERQPLTVEQWQEHTKALAVVNAGQYNKKGVHLGLLLQNGVNLGTRMLSVWKGIFAAEPARAGLPRAALIDLAEDRFDPAAAEYTQAVQSLMLLDRHGRKRVRESDWKANRTVLALDRQGRVVLLCTEGAFTLWEMASWLQESEMDVFQAMSLDGGHQAEMIVAVDNFKYVTYGQWVTNDLGNLSLPGYKATLPAIIGVFPRN